MEGANRHSSCSLTQSHSEPDPFLTAARLLRGGWLSNVRPNCGPGSAGERRSDRIQEPQTVEVQLKDPGTNRGLFKRTAQTKQQPGGAAGVLIARSSGCRSACRNRRRLRAPVLPTITEM